MQATLGDAFDNLSGGICIKLTSGEVIEKKKRLSTLDDQIIDAHGNEINADSVVNADRMRDFKFCADTIRRRNQNRVFKTGCFEIKETAKTTEITGDAGPVG